MGAREMRHQAQRTATRRKALDDRGHVGRRKTQPVHAGVDLDPQRRYALLASEPLDLLHVVGDRFEPIHADFGEFTGFERTFEQHDCLRDAGIPQTHCFFDGGDAKGVGVAQRARHADETVAVAVGLDDREHPPAGGTPANDGQIAAHRLRIEDDPRGSRH